MSSGFAFSDLSISTLLSVGAALVGVTLAYAAVSAENKTQTEKIAALERALDVERKEREARDREIVRLYWRKRRSDLVNELRP